MERRGNFRINQAKNFKIFLNFQKLIKHTNVKKYIEKNFQKHLLRQSKINLWFTVHNSKTFYQVKGKLFLKR